MGDVCELKNIEKPKHFRSRVGEFGRCDFSEASFGSHIGSGNKFRNTNEIQSFRFGPHAIERRLAR